MYVHVCTTSMYMYSIYVCKVLNIKTRYKYVLLHICKPFMYARDSVYYIVCFWFLVNFGKNSFINWVHCQQSIVSTKSSHLHIYDNGWTIFSVKTKHICMCIYNVISSAGMQWHSVISTAFLNASLFLHVLQRSGSDEVRESVTKLQKSVTKKFFVTDFY